VAQDEPPSAPVGPTRPGRGLRPSTFNAFRSREYRLLWIGLVVSVVGQQVQVLGLGLLIVQLAVRDGVPHLAGLYVGIVGASRALPGLAFGLYAGVLSDRMDRRRLLMIVKLLGSLAAAALAVLVLTNHASIPSIAIITAVASATQAFEVPTRNAMLPRLVPPQDLMSAVGMTTSINNMGMIFGPLLGGILILPLGIGGLMVVNAAMFLASVFVLQMMKPQPVASTRHVEHVGRAFLDGLKYTMSESLLKWVIITSVLISLFQRPLQQLLPVVAHDTLHVGALQLSWMLSAFGVGAFVGSMGSASIGAFKRRALILMLSLIELGGALLIFSFQRDLVPALLMLFLTGIGWVVYSAMASALLQTRAPDELRGRAISIYVTSATAISPLGALVLGSLSSLFNISVSLMIGGIVILVASIMILALKRSIRT
jgi:MFS family permease